MVLFLKPLFSLIRLSLIVINGIEIKKGSDSYGYWYKKEGIVARINPIELYN